MGELILAGSAMRVKLRDDSRHRNDLPVAFRQRFDRPAFARCPLIDNFKVVIFDHFGTVAGFEVVVLIWIRERKTEGRQSPKANWNVFHVDSPTRGALITLICFCLLSRFIALSSSLR